MRKYLIFLLTILPYMGYGQVAFTEAPRAYRLYARNDQNSAMVKIAGTVSSAGQDSLLVDVFKNGSLWKKTGARLTYSEGKAAFSTEVSIHAELSNYRFKVYTKDGVTRSQVLDADSVVCGDAYMILGQSNAVSNSGGALTYQNQWVRSFGTSSTDPTTSRNDTVWGIAQQRTQYEGRSVGVWGHKVADMIVKNYNIPVCMINGAVIGTKITLHLPSATNLEDMNTIYGRAIYRARKAGIADQVKAILWYQGESDTHATLWSGYYTNFQKLYAAWKRDYSAPKKVYVFQVRPGCDKNLTHRELREQQRQLPSIDPATIQLFSTSWISGFNGCHYNVAGYGLLGAAVYRLVARDFYNSMDVNGITPPNIRSAYFTNGNRNQVNMVFDQPVVWGADTLGRQLKDYFYFTTSGTTTSGIITGWSVSKDTVKLQLNTSLSSGTTIGYLPPFDYADQALFYQGPWLKNSRGVGALSFFQVPISNNSGDSFYISGHPANSTICAGSNTAFAVVAVGSNLSYQWQVSSDGGSTWNNLSNGGVYSNVTAATMNITAATFSMNSYRYRCAVSNGTSTLNSNVAILTVNFAPMITAHPANATATNGSASFSVSATGASLSYQWQVSSDAGATWNNLANGGMYSNVTTPTMSITGATSAINQYRYRALVTGMCNPAGTSNSAVLTVQGGPMITAHPVDASTVAGGNASFSVSASGTGLTYQWQVSTDAGATWNNLGNSGVYSNVTAATMTITGATVMMDNYRYRCVVSGTYPPAATSNAARLSVGSSPVITAHPANVSIAAGSDASFSVTATGAGLTYQWQVSMNAGVTWGDITNGGVYSNVTTATMNITGATAAMDDYRYRCVVSNAYPPSATSNVAVLRVGSAPLITAQPVNASTSAGGNASFSITATGTALTYQWQLSTDAGATWNNLGNSGVYSNVTAATMNITGATAAMDGYRYRCVVSGTYSPAATSEAATLSVGSSPVITAHPANASIGAGNNASFSVSASGAGLTYQWQVSMNAGSTWGDLNNGGVYSNVTTATMNITGATTAMDDYRYRCVVSGTHPPAATSNAAVLRVGNAPVITAHPVDVSIVENNTASFSVTASGAGLSFQWQFSSDWGATWSNLSNGGWYSNVTTATMSITSVPLSLNSLRYRCVVTGTYPPVVISNAALLTVISSGTPPSSSFATGDYISASSGTWGSGGTATWQRYNMPNPGWNASSAPSTATTNTVFIAADHTITTSSAPGNAVRIVVLGGANFNMNHTSTVAAVTVKAQGTMTVNQELTIQTNGQLWVEDEGTLVLQHDFNDPATSIWNGIERFAPASHLYIQFWKVTVSSQKTFFNGEVSLNTYDGYTAAFGNLYINFTRAITTEWEMLGDGANGKNLCHGNLELRQGGGYDVRLTAGKESTNITLGIRGNLVLTEQWAAPRNFMIAAAAGVINFTVGGDVIVNGTGGFNVHASNSATGSSTLNVEGSLLVNNGKFLLNRITYWTITALTTTLNVKGSVKVAATGLLQNFAPIAAVSMNMTGSTVQELNCASSVRAIPMFIKSGAIVKLKGSNLSLNSNSSITVENGGTMDFGFNDAGTVALYVFGASGTTSFTLQQGGILKITSPDGLEADSKGNVRTLNRTFNNGGVYYYTGTGQQFTGKLLPSVVSGLYIDKTRVTDVLILNSLPSTLQVTNMLNLSRGRFMLDTRTLEIGTSSANGMIVQAANASDSYIVMDTMAVVKQYVNSAVATHHFPVGDDYFDYSPCTVDFKRVSSPGEGAFVSVQLADAREPHLSAATATHLTRYWRVDGGGLGSSYEYDLSFTYVNGDKVGSEVLVPARWNNSWQKAQSGSFTQVGNTFKWNSRSSFGNYSAVGNSVPFATVIVDVRLGLVAEDPYAVKEQSAASALTTAGGRTEVAEQEVMLDVYPNPATEMFTLTMKNNARSKVSIVIYDVSGNVLERRVIEKADETMQTTFDIYDYKSGSYVVEIICGSERSIRRIVKQ